MQIATRILLNLKFYGQDRMKGDERTYIKWFYINDNLLSGIWTLFTDAPSLLVKTV